MLQKILNKFQSTQAFSNILRVNRIVSIKGVYDKFAC